MKVSVHGDSLYAWVVAGILAETGNQVYMDASCASNYPGREPGLDVLLTAQQLTGRLTCGAAGHPGVDEAAVHVLASGNDADEVREVIERIMAGKSRPAVLLVLVSLPVGSLDKLQAYADARFKQGLAVHPLAVVGMPLFVREGSALVDFYRPHVMVISGDEGSRSIQTVMELMRPFARQARHVMIVTHPAAELIKMGVTAMLAMRVSFINEMAALAEKLNVDIDLVREGLAADPRIGGDYLHPGCGFGGPSFANELLSYSRTVNAEIETAGLIDAVIAINNSQREILFRKLWRFFRGRLSGLRVAIWGAAFKPGTASLENSVVHPLLAALWAQDCHTVVYDPLAGYPLKSQYETQPLLEAAATAMDAARGADALVIVTEWEEFSNPDFEELMTLLKTPAIFDGRNIYDPDFLREHGFRYFAIGRGESI